MTMGATSPSLKTTSGIPSPLKSPKATPLGSLGPYPRAARTAPRSSEYGTFELVYELPMSALSGGVGLGPGVGRGRGVDRGPLFAVTAPMARMRKISVAIVLICFSILSSLRILPSEVLEFLRIGEIFSLARDCRGEFKKRAV